MIVDYFKGIGGLILVALLAMLAIVFFFVFELVVGAVLAILAIVAILVLPYYFGKSYEKEKHGNYKLKKIK